MQPRVFQFGEFTLDTGQFSLERRGLVEKLQRKPMELLILLAEHGGQLVTRQEIAAALWGGEVFVDTEHGINTAIRKVRQALCEDSGKTRLLETVTGKGYRLNGCTAVHSPSEAESVDTASPSPVQPDVQPLAAAARAHATPRGLPLWVWVAVAAVLLTATLSLRFYTGHVLAAISSAATIHSVAVLPLANYSSSPDQQYLADGMTDELITMLAKSSTLRVVSRRSVMRYQHVDRPLPEIARELGVDSIVEGSLARSGESVHLNLRLIAAKDDTHLWAESYDRPGRDAAQLPREAAETIASRLGQRRTSPSTPQPVNPAAYDAYLRGRYLWFSGELGDNNEKAGALFRQAITLDPNYALGWSGLSIYYGAGMAEGTLDPAVAMKPEGQAARRAVELDDQSAEAHLALGSSYFLVDWDPVQADRELGRAIALDPRFAEVHHFRAKMLAALNRQDEALAEQRRATELDPFGKPWALALALIEARRYEEALAEIQQRLETVPRDSTLLWLRYDLYRAKGMHREAVNALEIRYRLCMEPALADAVRLAYTRGGYRGVLSWQLAQATERTRTHYVSPMDFARIYGELSERDKTLTLLEDAVQHRAIDVLWIENDPAYDFLHDEPRYRALVAKLPASAKS